MSYGFYRFIRFVTAPIVRILWPTKVSTNIISTKWAAV